VLKIEATGVSALKIGDSDNLQVGDHVASPSAIRSASAKP
jgi:S1-C subfamily serine protease